MPEPMEYAGIHHVQLAMPAGGEDEARGFYADVLGLRELPTDVVDDDAIDTRRFYTADPFGNRIELVEARGQRRERPR